jgi:hypothetical protein
MENLYRSIIGKNQFMKKRIFVAVVLLAGTISYAQQKKEKVPPPPPPAVIDNNQISPPPAPPPEAPAPPVQLDYAPLPANGNNAFLKRNPTVKSIEWSDDNAVRIHLKSGKEEMYDLSKPEEAQRLKKKYGELPIAPPAPPTPPTPPQLPGASK